MISKREKDDKLKLAAGATELDELDDVCGEDAVPQAALQLPS